MITALIVTAVTLSPFIVIYEAVNGLFAWDDRRWRKSWDHYRRCPPPRPTTLGNVVPASAPSAMDGADTAAALASEAATEVAEDD